MNNIISFSMIVSALILSSCGNGQYTPLKENPSVSNTTYQDHVKPIIDHYCIKCHSGNEPARGIDLSTYDVVKVHAKQGRLLHRIMSSVEPMPPSGMLSAIELETIRRWSINDFVER